MKRQFLFLLLLVIALLTTQCRKDIETQEDNKFATGFLPAGDLSKIPSAPLPTTRDSSAAIIDLSTDMPPVCNQGKQASCAGCAVGYALMSYREKIQKKHAYLLPNGSADLTKLMSPAFIFNQVKVGSCNNSGSYLWESLKLIKDQGVCSLADMPYDPEDCTRIPNTRQHESAMQHRISSYGKIDFNDIGLCKRYLAGGTPIVIGIQVDTWFMSAKGGFIWNTVSQPAGSLSGHALLVVGYDNSKNVTNIFSIYFQYFK